jgi:hypothetical protein
VSGPKSAHYHLVSWEQAEAARREAERLLQERLSALLTRSDRAEEQLSLLAHEHEILLRDFPNERIDVSIPKSSRPATTDLATLQDYVLGIERQIHQTTSRLRAAGAQARGNSEFKKAMSSAAKRVESAERSALDVLGRIAMGLPRSKNADERKNELHRWLARLKPGVTTRSELTDTARRFLSAGSDQEANALGIEIRLIVQKLNEEAQQRNSSRREAIHLLSALADESSGEVTVLRRRLERVIVSEESLSPDLLEKAREAARSVAAIRSRELHAAACAVLKDSLNDLGYDVGPIATTLFMDGGVAFFKKPGWDDYCVRMSVRPQQQAVNFNVARLPRPAEHLESRDVSRAIENEWCDSLRDLMSTLHARGIGLRLTRETEAGALPVPVVSSRELPADFHWGSASSKAEREKRTKSTPSK